MRRTDAAVLPILILAACSPTTGTEPPMDRTAGFSSVAALRAALEEAAVLEDGSARTAALEAVWDTLRVHHAFPFVLGDSVAFLYRGPAGAVAVPGDFNGWNPDAGRAVRLDPLPVWIREESFPPDSRLDYKFFLDGSTWILDPENPLVQRSGFGDNSELRMPEYVPSPYVEPRDGVPRGGLSPERAVASAALGYTVHYRVYTPAGYEDLSRLPSIYVTDGHEYADARMGSMVIVLDNLIAEGRMKPVIAVFIDPRVGGRNLRSEQYVMNPAFVRFVSGELVPAVDGAYRTDRNRASRAVLGTSLGGLNSAYFALEAPDTFRLIGIQSPAFQVANGEILDRFRAADPPDVRVFMSWGTFHDLAPTSEEMKSILDAKGIPATTRVLHEGHSWGAWRALLDDLLVDFWPAGSR